MTKQEAIQVLETKGCYECSGGCQSPIDCNNVLCELRQATEMAIKSLQQTKWIPCNERLPQENGLYLVSYHYKEFGMICEGVTCAAFGNKQRWFLDGWWVNTGEHCPVKAWMTLPEFYKGEQNE